MPSFGRQSVGLVVGQSVGPVVGLVTREYGAADFPRVSGCAFSAKAGGDSAADKDIIGKCLHARRHHSRRVWLRHHV